jgi:hypothetical protein
MKIDVVEGMIASGMILRSWDDPQSSGIWVALGDDELLLDALQEKVNGGLQDNIELKTYFQGSGAWLPIAITNSLICSLKVLELKLKEMPTNIVDKSSDYRKKWDIALKTILGETLLGDID